MKNWQTVAAANVHNARTKPLAHAVKNAPAPVHLIGSGNLVADVKSSLRGVDLNPDKLRKNGVIAYEAILTASAAFFNEGNAEERQERLDRWVAEQVKWAIQRYGILRVVSMVLHVDEKTPHIHLVLLPLEAKPDRRFGDKDCVRWNLVGRMISGPGKFDEVQDVYAAAMAQFGLVRGLKGSGKKHEPVPVYLARMAAKEAAVDGARQSIERDRQQIDADRERLEQFRIKLINYQHKMRHVTRAAQDFMQQIEALKGQSLTAAAQAAWVSASRLQSAARTVYQSDTIVGSQGSLPSHAQQQRSAGR